MKFKKLREATLTKTQIKKVHDKADDLPKNDFIKRYGKDGDSVRFATATKMVKKELGIEESSIMGLNKSSAEYKAGKEAAKKGIKYDDNPHAPGVKRLNWSTGHNDFRAAAMRKSGKPNYGARGQFEDTELTEAISDAQVAQIARMTDRNDHFGVRIEIARLMKDKQLMSFYDSLEKMHMTSQIQNAIGNDAVNLRGKLEKVLKVRMKQRFGDKDSKRIMDAL